MPRFGRRRAAEPEPTPPPYAPLPAPPQPGEDGLRSMADHRDYLLSCVSELPPFGQHILDALGLALCEDIVAEVSLPRFDNSAMDGYAVRAEDVADAIPEAPVSLPVVGEIAAGQPPPHPLSPHTAMKIMTGAPLPARADAIVPYEATDRGATDVGVSAPSRVGQHIRRTGEDIAAGRQMFAVGHQVGVWDIGVLAALGHDKVLVRPRPRVVVIATGTELVDPGYRLSRAEEIYDSNSFLLAAAAQAAGAEAYRIGHVGDDPERVLQRIADQLVRADLILTTGGVSQGDYDVVKAVLPELGACDFAGVAMQPGKPQGFGLIGEDRTPIIMLPGNPVSAYVSFEAFVRPVIRKLMGRTPYVRETARCRATAAMRSTAGRTQLARGRVTTAPDGTREVALVGGHGSHLLGDLSQANALVLLPREVTAVAPGDEVEVWLLDPVLGESAP